MKKLKYCLLIVAGQWLLAQNVGIGTSSPRATLEVVATKEATKADGIMLPSISLATLTSKGNNVYTTAHRGTVLYINNVSGGDKLVQRVNIDTVGYYFFDGNVWQKLQKDISLYNGNSNLTSNRIINLDGKSLSFTNTSGSPLSNQFSIANNTLSIDTESDQIGIGNSNPKTRLDIRTDTASNNDPGEGMFGLGTTDLAANVAGAGAVRYNLAGGGGLQYSNGITWQNLESSAEKYYMIARQIAGQTFQNDTFENIVNWSVTTSNVRTFNASTGIFTAPRAGSYIVSFSLVLNPSNFVVGSYLQIGIRSTNPVNDIVRRLTYPNSGSADSGNYITQVVKLEAGEQIRCTIYQNSGGSKSLRTANTGNAAGFVNFSVVEI